MSVKEAIEYALETFFPSLSTGPRPGAAEIVGPESMLPGASPVEAKALNKAGKLAWEQGDHASARTSHEESLRLHRLVGSKPGIALSLNNLGLVALYQGDYASAECLHEESLALRRELRDKRGTASSLHNLGLVALYQDNHARAEAYFEESLSLSRELGDKWIISNLLNNLGLMVLHQGDHRRASELQRESLNLRREMGDRGGIAECLEGLAGISAAREQPSRAVRLWSAAEAVRDTIGAPPPPGHRALYETYLARARSSETEEAWEAARVEGGAMTLEEAVGYALGNVEEPTPPAPSEPAGEPAWPGLTRREREVATLAARGLSNRRVAGRLSISERTVETHVRNVLKKLGLRSRFQIAERLPADGRG